MQLIDTLEFKKQFTTQATLKMKNSKYLIVEKYRQGTLVEKAVKTNKDYQSKKEAIDIYNKNKQQVLLDRLDVIKLKNELNKKSINELQEKFYYLSYDYEKKFIDVDVRDLIHNYKETEAIDYNKLKTK